MMMNKNLYSILASAVFLLTASAALSKPRSLDSNYKSKTPFAKKIENRADRENYVRTNPDFLETQPIRDNKYDYNSYTGPQQGLNFKKLDALAPANAKRITDIEPTSNADFKDVDFAPTLPVNGLQVKTKQIEQPKLIERKTIRAIPDDRNLYPWQKSPNSNLKNNRLNGGGAVEIENDPVNGSFFF